MGGDLERLEGEIAFFTRKFIKNDSERIPFKTILSHIRA